MKDYGLTILRIFVGVVFVMHAYLQLFRFTPAGFAQFMEKVAGLPAPVVAAWIVMIIHGLGGIMLILGLWTRPTAAANAVVMLMALITVNFKQGFFMKVMKSGSVGGFELVFLLLGASLALVLAGGGALAVRLNR